MIVFISLLFTISLHSFVTGDGIPIPKDNCRLVYSNTILRKKLLALILLPILFQRWITAPDWDTELKCDGNEVAVGSCSGGGGWGHKDCPGGTVHQLKCCEMPEYYYSNCNTFNSDFGVPIDCRDHGDGLILEGQCHSGEHHDCHGSANLGTCCEGTYQGRAVGPVETECTWEYGGYGAMLECGRSDEVLAGRCGSGKNLDCPGGTSHGNLCCKLDFLGNNTFI